MKTLSPRQAHDLVHGSGEFAFLDVRELVPFGRGHAFLAAHLAWSRFELDVGRRVPRLDTPILLCDQAGELAPRAAARLDLLGYRDVAIVDGGADGWAAAGLALFAEIEVPAKGFGAFARIHGKPRYISPLELKRKLDSDEDWIVLDSRPMAEFTRGCIPGGIDAAGADVFRCFDDLVPDPSTRVVVNCMSATRGTLGGLSLLAGGVPNEVYVLHHGTRGWLLDGLELEVGARRVPDPPSEHAIASARARAARIRDAAGIAAIDAAQVARWRTDTSRTTYLFDVRSPAEFAAGHIAGAVNAPEGRIVLSTEDFLATRNARIVLSDDDTSRASITALWLAQMGWGEVVVCDDGLDGHPLETGPAASPFADVIATLRAHEDPRAIDPASLATGLAAGTARVVDVGSSAAWVREHISGSRWLTRSEVVAEHQAAPPGVECVFTSETGEVAALAAFDCLVAGAGNATVAWLAGGNRGWREAGHATVSGEEGLGGERVDLWLAASERPGDVTDNVIAYLDWETRLMDEIEAAGEAPYRDLIWSAGNGASARDA